MWRLLNNGEEKQEGDETFVVSGRDFGWCKIRTSSSGSLWLEGDLPVRRKISEKGEAETLSASPTNSDYTAVLVEALKDWKRKAPSAVCEAEIKSLSAHLNSAIKASQNCA
jgi:hypothetical protein